MLKKLIIIFLIVVGCFYSKVGMARQGFSIGLGPVGNIFVIDDFPVLDPGVGGHMFFQYRFHQQVAFETSFMMTTQDGDTDGVGTNDDPGILFLGMPMFDIKFFLLEEGRRLDPFLGTGLGIYWLTEGRLSANNSGGMGLGAHITVGFDYYLANAISVGFQGVFRSIPIINSFSRSGSAVAIFPFSLMGNVAFHF